MDSPDREIAEAIASTGGSTVSKMGLRFDRVALRLLDRLRSAVAARPQRGLTVVLALTAPIRIPGKTAAALEQEVVTLLQTGGAGTEWSATINGNRAELRLVEQTSSRSRGLVGFVHNADVPSARVLDLAEQWLRSSD